ncbi:hypothetical protein BSL78_29465 [Apostichopus japonicus]|uniref:APCDD1 domain-containing protein n=1 Tax=Stichopus japonicus TaxID=307972 RepID=A0A2G8JDA3_STIJA|nr:hypothetical protein BSL78_29465 [Apostichopus japonicus]
MVVIRLYSSSSILSSSVNNDYCIDTRTALSMPSICYLYYKDCEICQEVHKGSEGQPPVLPKRTAFVPAPLHGEWASLTCEARPMYFLTRHFIFLGNTTWEAHYHFYSDPNCRTPIYSLSLKGTHSQPEPSKNVPGGTIVNLHSLGMLLTPQHRDMVRTLNMLSKGVCAGKAWKLGPTYDVTDTAECTSLGSLVPSTEYELVKIEVDPLYGLVMFLGQMPSDGSGKYEEHKRPTAYQEPLVHCEGEDPRQRVQNNTNHNGCSICVVSMWTWLGSLWCYLLVVNM